MLRRRQSKEEYVQELLFIFWKGILHYVVNMLSWMLVGIGIYRVLFQFVDSNRIYLAVDRLSWMLVGMSLYRLICRR